MADFLPEYNTGVNLDIPSVSPNFGLDYGSNFGSNAANTFMGYNSNAPGWGFNLNPSPGTYTPPSIWNQLSGTSTLGTGQEPTFSQKFAGYINPKTGNQISGFGGPAFQALSALGSGYLGYREMKTAENALNFQKEAFSKQFENQRKLINNDLRDRDSARTARDPNYKSTTKFI